MKEQKPNAQLWQGQSEAIKYLTTDELGRLFATVRRAKKPMHIALFKLMFQFGLRISEAVRLKIDSLGLAEKRIIIERSKRKDKFRVMSYALDTETLDVLRRWLRAREKHRAVREWDNPYLFLSQKCRSADDHLSAWMIEHWFGRYAEAANIPAEKQHPHALRHSCGMMLAKAGLNAEEIRQRLGHVSLISTQIYCQLGGKEAEDASRRADEALKIPR